MLNTSSITSILDALMLKNEKKVQLDPINSTVRYETMELSTGSV